ncbi:hypothetical protein ACKWRH_23540 [Bradyrhizobium sp. Pa8]|uniref:hypothetical protein n=1 Tax=Bradyrhizobium sp. Pa8 TaxID=3386552 RepID=UPI00403EFE0D
MSVPFLSVKPRAIKLKVSPRFPARLIGRAGIDVTKENGNYFLDLDYSDFPVIGSVPPQATYALIFDPATGKYAQVSTSLIAGGGIAPATATPLIESGAGAVGTSVKYAREDHVHPAFGGGGGGASVTISDTPPASPTANSLWWESDTGILFIYYNDGSSSQWVSISAGQPTGAVRYDVVQALTASQKLQARQNIGAVLQSYLVGLTLSTPGLSATFSVASGICADSTNSDAMRLAASISKTTNAWAVGTGAGALDTGTIANATWYHAYLIKRPDTGIVDVLISLSASAPTLPANYTLFRRIGAMFTTGSAQWVYFVQNGDEFLWGNQIADVSIVTIAATSLTPTLSVPTGLKVNALITFRMDAVTGNTGGLVSSLDHFDQVPGGAYTSLFVGTTSALAAAGWMNIRTNVNGQIRVRGTGATATYSIMTMGWVDRRGRDN